jgi:hypothetical protein
MPTTNKAAKAVFDSGKTSSYHIDSLVSCQQSGKSSSAFRMVMLRDGGNKRYEFEAESAKLASAFSSFLFPSITSIALRLTGWLYVYARHMTDEIVQTIKGLKSALERRGSITGKARRSKQIS